MRTVVRSSLLVLLTASAAATATVSLGVREEPPRSAAPPVLRVAAPGFVEPRHGELTISARQAGTLTDVLVQEGQSVKAGESLVRFDDRLARTVLATARAEQAAAQAALTGAEVGRAQEEVAVRRARLAEAETRVSAARRRMQRIDPLLEKGIVSQRDVDAAADEIAIAEAQAEVARRELEIALRGDLPHEIARVRALRDAAASRVAEAEGILDDHDPRAPRDGTILRLHKRVGETVLASEPLLTMGDLSRRRVRAEFRDSDILKLKAGQPSRIQAGFGGSTCDGSVERLGVSAVTRSVSIERSTERIDYRVVEAWIALSADCRLPVGARVDVLVCLDETDRGCSSRTDPGTKPPDHPRERVVAAER